MNRIIKLNSYNKLYKIQRFLRILKMGIINYNQNIKSKDGIIMDNDQGGAGDQIDQV